MEKLRKLFYDKLGGISLPALIKESSKLDIPPREVREFYANQKVNQVNKQTRILKRHFMQIVAPQIGYISADLMDFDQHTHANGGNKYILTVIDTYSRYAWAFPLKNKSPTSILPCLEKVNKDLGTMAEGQYIRTFTVDYGSEFLGSVKKYLDENKVKIYIAQDKNNSTFKLRTAIIERFNRTLSDRLTRATDIVGNTKWVPLLEKVIDSYNHSEHRSIGRSPYDILVKHKKPILIQRESVLTYEPEIGDFVRTITNQDGSLIRKKGLRGSSAFSDSVYQVLYREGNRYGLAKAGTFKRANNGLYLARQLQKVPSKESEEYTPNSTVQEEKKQAKTTKTLKLKQAKEPEKLPAERLLGKTLLAKIDEKTRTKKLPAKLRD
jgi:hypothetical protein